MAIVKPRWALALAADRRNAGRSGSDLILVIFGVLIATQLRGFVGAVWLSKAVDATLGMRAAMQILTRTLTIDLAFLVLGAFVLYAGAGPKRNLGRAFDLSCVAALPLLLVELAATTVLRATDLQVPMQVAWMLAAISWGWSGALLALAWRWARAVQTPELPVAARKPARIAGSAVAVVAVVGLVFQILWITQHVDSMRPVAAGNNAPAFSLPAIGANGQLGDKLGITPGRVTVVDFWATWCKPCIASLPHLEQLAETHGDVDVIAVNLDDAAAARSLFDRKGYTAIHLVMDDGEVSERYSVNSIPHTVVIGRDGVVAKVFRGGTTQLEKAVEEIRK